MGKILGMARLAVLAGALALTGCVTTTENSLSKNDIVAMKLTGVTVSYAPDASIQWDDGIRAYAASKGIVDDVASAANTPEGKAYVQNMLASRVKSGVERQMAGHLNGTRPVRLDIVVQSFTISSAVQRIVVGGGHGMVGDANLVDARTGAVIIAYPRLTAFLFAGQGVLGTAVEAALTDGGQTTLGRIVDEYGRSYREWLLRRA
jgi:hypothetical protein